MNIIKYLSGKMEMIFYCHNKEFVTLLQITLLHNWLSYKLRINAISVLNNKFLDATD